MFNRSKNRVTEMSPELGRWTVRLSFDEKKWRLCCAEILYRLIFWKYFVYVNWYWKHEAYVCKADNTGIKELSVIRGLSRARKPNIGWLLEKVIFRSWVPRSNCSIRFCLNLLRIFFNNIFRISHTLSVSSIHSNTRFD